MKLSHHALPFVGLAVGLVGSLGAAPQATAQHQDAPSAEPAPYRLAAGQVIRPAAWSSPVAGYRITGEFGDTGSWASTHTGLDFAVAYGTPIRAVAAGVVSEASYDGSFGNKTVVTLPDGTEVWYCHQEAVDVAPGERISTGEVIGEVGMTGNTTGPHLHLEVRAPGRGPVDPAVELEAHRVDV